MFTGLVEAVGEVTEVKPTTGGSRLRLSTQLAPELANGDSLAVNGCCLTVVSSPYAWPATKRASHASARAMAASRVAAIAIIG